MSSENNDHHDTTDREELDSLYGGSLFVSEELLPRRSLADAEGNTIDEQLDSLEPKSKGLEVWGEFDLDTMLFTKCPTSFHREALDQLLVALDKHNVDDVVLQSDEKIFAKIGSDYYAVSARAITFSEISSILAAIHRDSTPGKVRSGEFQRFSYSVPYQEKDDGPVRHVRFRVDATACQGLRGSQDGIDITMRCMDAFPKTMDELNVPKGIRELAFPEAGIVLVTGETGSGKTTLLGAIMRFWATTPKGRRIIAYNDPIEYDYRAIPGRTGSIAQTEVGEMIADFSHAVPNAMRRNPCIIELGEVSEQVGIKNVIVAAQTGHRVYTTVHTESVAITLSRMVEPFSQEEQTGKIRALISTTRGIVHQRLLDAKDGGRVPVQEWLQIGPTERKALYNSESSELVEVLQNLVETRGRSLLQDLESKKHLIEEEAYFVTKQELVGRGEDQ